MNSPLVNAANPHSVSAVVLLLICTHAAWSAPIPHSALGSQIDDPLSQTTQFSLFSGGLSSVGNNTKDFPLEVECLDCALSVEEGAKGVLLFEVKNLSDHQHPINLTITKSFTTGPTTGDTSDWTKGLSNIGCSGVLGAEGVCFISLEFKTDFPDLFAHDSGNTTLTEKVVAFDGHRLYSASADSTVTVHDCGNGNGICRAPIPEPSTLMMVGTGILGLLAVIGKRG